MSVSHYWLHIGSPGDYQQPPMLGTAPQDSDFIDLGCDLGSESFENSSGDSHMQPR